MKTIFAIFPMMVVLLLSWNADGFDLPPVDIHGFVSQGYLISSDYEFLTAKTDDGTFEFNEIGVSFTTRPAKRLRVGIQLLSRDFGENGDNEVEVDWAYGDYRIRNWLGVKAGLMKRPYGLFNQSRDIDAARTEILLPTSIYPEISRAFYLATQGVGVYGILPAGLSYEIQYGIVPLSTDEGFVRRGERMLDTQAQNVSNDHLFAYSLRWDTPVDGLTFAFSGLNLGDVDIETPRGTLTTSRFDAYVGSVQYLYDRFAFAAEYKLEIESNELLGMTLLDDKELEAYYARVSYRFNDWFEFALGYSVIFPDRDDRDGENFEAMGLPEELAWNRDLFLSAKFDINPYWIFKLEGHYMNGLVGVTGPPPIDPSENWFLFAAKTTFSF